MKINMIGGLPFVSVVIIIVANRRFAAIPFSFFVDYSPSSS